MIIYLVQHGNQNPEDIDPDERLSNKGRTDCENVAAFAKNTGLEVSKIFHSVKLRAKQTAEIFAKYLLEEGAVPEEREGLKPMDDVTIWKDKLSDELMLVGHMPFMSKFSALLVNDDQEKPVVTFQQGSILCLEQDEDRNWSVKFFITPDLF